MYYIYTMYIHVAQYWIIVKVDHVRRSLGIFKLNVWNSNFSNGTTFPIKKNVDVQKLFRNLAWIKFIEWPSKNFFRQFIIRNIIIENNLSINLNSILVALCHPFIYCKYYKIYSIPFNLKRLNYQKFQYAFFYNFTNKQFEKIQQPFKLSVNNLWIWWQ